MGEDLHAREGAKHAGVLGVLTDAWAAIERRLGRDAPEAAPLRSADPDPRHILDAMKLGVTVHDARGVILYCNPAEARLHGYDPDDLVGQPASILGAPEIRGSQPHPASERHDHWQRDSLNVRKTGEVFPVRLRSDVIRGQGGAIVGVVTTCEDISAAKRAEERQSRDALEDALTGLANRDFFLQLLARTVKRTARQPDLRFAVLYTNFHRFGLINETLGHEAGDHLLAVAGTLLKDTVRPTDVAARIASDEFAVLLDGIRNRTDATRVAERILERFEQPFTVNAKEVYLSPHIGIAVSQAGIEDPLRYLKDANQAMFRARDGGEKGYAVFDVTVHRRATQRLQLETDLRRAIQQDELRAFYQPIVDLKTGGIVGFEALARWAHPQRGMTPPGEFIAAAEETGLVVPMGSWMLRAACRQLSEWRQKLPGWELSMNVNFSARHLRQANVVDEVQEVLRETGLAPECLKLELTETVLMEGADYHVGILQHLRDVGIAVVIDDFGTGYSSLSYLQRFPVHALKIDRSFVAAAREKGDWDIVRMIIALARDKKALVVAEGVEDEQQAQRLIDLGCDRAQGYLYSRPVEAEVAEQLLHAR